MLTIKKKNSSVRLTIKKKSKIQNKKNNYKKNIKSKIQNMKNTVTQGGLAAPYQRTAHTFLFLVVTVKN